MSRTLVELANESLAVQDACNLSGVAQAFARAMVDLRAHVSGTYPTNIHPITRLWVDKLASLAGIQTFGDDEGRMTQAYSAVYGIVDAAKGLSEVSK